MSAIDTYEQRAARQHRDNAREILGDLEKVEREREHTPTCAEADLRAFWLGVAHVHALLGSVTH